jgi:hypothetical protein
MAYLLLVISYSHEAHIVGTYATETQCEEAKWQPREMQRDMLCVPAVMVNP